MSSVFDHLPAYNVRELRYLARLADVPQSYVDSDGQRVRYSKSELIDLLRQALVIRPYALRDMVNAARRLELECRQKGVLFAG